MDRTRDGKRAFKTFSKEDLKRWRMLREAEEKANAKAKMKDVAKEKKITPSTFGKSVKKVNEYIVEYVKDILKRRGI